MEARTIRTGFLNSVRAFPDRPALAIQDATWSYRDLFQRAAAVAVTMDAHSAVRPGRLTGVFGHRSVAAFSGVLGALLRGDGYVPLNPAFPAERNRSMAERAELDWIVAEAASLGQLGEMLEGMENTVSVLVPDSSNLDTVAARLPQHRFFGAEDLSAAEEWTPGPVDPNGIGYLLFTSGSTGIPKGVMVAHRNVTHFIDCMTARYGITEQDRFSQTFDLTFDLSAFDMFVAWEKGACVCCPTQQEKLFPARYIDAHGITIWFSVPSTAVLMKKLRMLKPERFPSIRYSLFCGEALPIEVAESFQRAAHRSVLENLYGPTELTIACTLYRYDSSRTPEESAMGVVPIGDPYPGMVSLIANENLEPCEVGEAGELLMSGPQLTLGYWQDAGKTAAAFVRPPGADVVYYRTGDRVVQRAHGQPLLYLGRVDNQIKVQGYRVELGEIEAVMREVARTEVAIALGHPVGDNGVEGIVGFVSRADADLEAVRREVCSRLPPYMQPGRMLHVDEFPLNANGKVDRGALRALLTP